MTDREEGGLFVPGHSIKSPGRPRGPSAAEQVRVLIEPHKEEIIAKAVELAKKGDPVSLRLCLERLAPTPRPEAEKVHVPGLADAKTFAGKCNAVIHAVSTGDISAEAGERVLRLLDVYRKAHETDDLARRLAATEAALGITRAHPAIETEGDPI